MTLASLAVLGATIVFSSFLSGIFGMAGGMILLGVLLNYFHVAAGQVLFSAIQLFANGRRVARWRKDGRGPIFGWAVGGAANSLVGTGGSALVPGKATAQF